MQLPWDNGVKNVRKNHALHVISGLPRSGSTLLSSLLSQNPDIYASISSPLLGAMLAVRNQLNMADYSASSLIKEDEQLDLYRNMIEGYYNSRRWQRNAVFDANRQWTSNLGLLHALSPDSKVIVCVRNMAAVINSFERFAPILLFCPNCLAGRMSGARCIAVSTP